MSNKIKITSYHLHNSRAPYNGEIVRETSSAKDACNWLLDGRGRVSAEDNEGAEYGCEPCNSRVLGKVAINLVRSDGTAAGCVDPY